MGSEGKNYHARRNRSGLVSVSQYMCTHLVFLHLPKLFPLCSQLLKRMERLCFFMIARVAVIAKKSPEIVANKQIAARRISLIARLQTYASLVFIIVATFRQNFTLGFIHITDTKDPISLSPAPYLLYSSFFRPFCDREPGRRKNNEG